MTIFTMFLIELLAARFDIFGVHEHDLESSDPSKNVLTKSASYRDEKPAHTHNHDGHADSELAKTALPVIAPSDTAHGSDIDSGESSSQANVPRRGSIPGQPDDFTYPPGGTDHLGHRRSHDDNHFAAQLTAIFILEFGVIFHSIFIGLTLAVTGDEFNVLYIVLVFHQTFEGLGLGSRLATAQWPKSKSWLPWVLGSAYGVSTPIAIAIGLGVRETFTPGSPTTMIVNGVFDSISAGILIYTGLVELMAHEFMFNQEMRKSSIKMMLFAYGCMCLGAGLMAVLGKWA